MTSIREAIRRRFSPIEPLEVGVYHYQSPPDAQYQYRLHLRIEPDGSGILIVNASTVLHLNRTAAEYAYHIVNQTTDEKVAETMAARYQVSREKALIDFRDIGDRIWTLIDVPDLDPITYLDFDRQSPYDGDLYAPYRIDCALTYQLPPGSDPIAAPTKRVDRELDTNEWKQIIDKAWQAGIPHIIFTGGEPTLRNDLFDLILHAEDKGQVTGILTDGLKLSDNDYLNRLLQSGLDHLMVVLQPDNSQAWEALENILPEDIFTAVHVTITEENAEQTSDILNRLANIGANAISLSATQSQLENSLHEAREKCAELELPLVWDLPVPYSVLNPVALETPDSLPDGAGKAWLYVEPDGDVLPAQGMTRMLGNFLRDSWESIWQEAKQ
ncbi:MAG: radical SAM protein [Anaerolineales bacterium]|jgi:organic radical activating enzyme